MNPPVLAGLEGGQSAWKADPSARSPSETEGLGQPGWGHWSLAASLPPLRSGPSHHLSLEGTNFLSLSLLSPQHTLGGWQIPNSSVQGPGVGQSLDFSHQHGGT